MQENEIYKTKKLFHFLNQTQFAQTSLNINKDKAHLSTERQPCKHNTAAPVSGNNIQVTNGISVHIPNETTSL